MNYKTDIEAKSNIAMQIKNQSSRQRLSSIHRNIILKNCLDNRCWLILAFSFLLLCIIMVLNETIDLPHILFGAEKTPFRLSEIIMEVALILAVGIPLTASLHRYILKPLQKEDVSGNSQNSMRKMVDERINEIECLYNASRLLDETGESLEKILGKVLELVCRSFKFPETTYARISCSNCVVKSDDFRETAWKLSEDIKVAGEKIGEVDLFYHGEELDSEEESLIRTRERIISELGGILGTFIQRRQQVQALSESEMMHRSLIEQSDDGIYFLYKDRFEITNRRFCEMFGVSQSEMQSPDFDLMDYVAPQSRILIENRRRMVKTGEKPSSQYEFFGRTKEGEEFEIQSSVKYIPYRDGTAVQGVLRDISTRKKLEDQLRQSQKMEGLGKLAGGVAHDFNNLLTVILGHAELSLMTIDKHDPIKDNLEEILASAKSASDLTRQLLAFSRTQTLQPKTLNINTFINDLYKMLRRIIGEDIELKIIPEKNLWNMKADPGQIEQVIINLVINARDAMPGGGVITIETRNVELDEDCGKFHADVIPGPYVMLAISDTGCGMTDEIKDHIFDPFFTTKEEGKGTGLGLSTVYGIINQSEGNIWVYSELGIGSTFKIYFPKIDKEAESFDREAYPIELPRGSETVLVVEDDEDVRHLVCRVLRQQGYTVSEARTGIDAYLICDKCEEPFNLLITDVIMPDIGGIELEAKLRKKWSDFKVLFMSGYTVNANIQSPVLDPDRPFLQKPFRAVDITWKVRKVLDS